MRSAGRDLAPALACRRRPWPAPAQAYMPCIKAGRHAGASGSEAPLPTVSLRHYHRRSLVSSAGCTFCTLMSGFGAFFMFFLGICISSGYE